MPIHERSYRHWEGKRRGRLSRSLTIARSGVTLALKKRGLVALVLLGITPAFLFGVLLYAAPKVDEFMRLASHLLWGIDWTGLLGKTPTLAAIWQLLFSKFLIVQLIPVAIVVAYVGPELISHDLRMRALQIYFSRPLTRADYLLGKLMVIGVFVAMLTLVPGVLLYIVGVVLERSIHIVGETYTVLLGVVGAYVLITLVAGAVMLACSSLSRRSGYVAIAWAMLIILGDVAHGLVAGAMAQKWSHLLSLRANVAQVLTRLFDAPPQYKFDWAASLFVLAAVFLAAALVLFKRLRSLEGEH
jgi:ABC-type transport system involved in multi-copper enzyme maturation permease subunit